MRIGQKSTIAALGLCAVLVPFEGALAQAEDCVPASHATLTPVVRAPAEYPLEAFMQGIEGYVLVSFDINQRGGVENLRIVESEPLGAFERGVIDAVRQWQYEPPTDYYGNVVRVCGKRQRFAYTLDTEEE